MPIITIVGAELLTDDVDDEITIHVNVGYDRKETEHGRKLQPVIHRVIDVKKNGQSEPYNPDQVRQQVEEWIKYNEKQFRQRINESLRSDKKDGWKAGESGGSGSPDFSREVETQ